MRLQRLMLTAFGRFAGRSLDLAPGLTIIYGENESGKTTIQKFMLGMLYGFKKRSLRREYTEDAARYRPWSGDEYRGALLYALDSGAAFRVERLFDPNRESVRVYEAETGADLTGSFAMDRRKELLFAEEHLRIPAEVFTSTAWVGQMEVGRLEMGRELVQRVANLSESGREDLSVRAALRIIDEQMREIGTDRAPTRPYARVSRLIGEKRQELERGLKSREQTLDWEAGLREARAAMAELDERIAEGQRHLAWSELAQAEGRYERIAASTAQMQAARNRARELSSVAFFPIDLKAPLREATGQAAQSQALLERHRRRLSALLEAREALSERLGQYAGLASLGADAAAQVAAAAQLADSGLSRLPGLHEEAARLEEMIRRIDEAIAPLTPAAEAGEQALTEMERLEHEIGAIAARLNPATVERLRADATKLERQRDGVGGTAWAVLSLLLLVGAGALYSVPLLTATPFHQPVVGAMAILGLIALIPFILTRRLAAQLKGELLAVKAQVKAAESAFGEESERIRRLERQREQTLRKLGVLSLGELRNQMIRYEQLTARRDGQEMRRQAVLGEIHRAEAELAAQQDRLRAILGIVVGDEPGRFGGRADSLERLQEAMTQYQAFKFELDSIQRDIVELEQRIAEEEERLAVAQREMEAILNSASVPDLAAFEESCRQHEEWRKAEREAEGLRQALSALLGEDDGSQVYREVERLRGLVEGEAPERLLAPALLQAEIRRMEAERSDWKARASDLAARVETAVAEIADTADLQREIQALQEEKQEMEAELSALELARSVIGEVSSQIHREFAPRLNRAMGEVVAAVTGGKYRSVRIDEDLRIRAIAEGDRTVEITSLSGGTVDQFYLALRVAILDLLTEGQERIPLLLDDPFVQYDNERLRSAMQYLMQVAEQRQVVLMTCHRREVRLARELGAHIIELSELPQGAD